VDIGHKWSPVFGRYGFWGVGEKAEVVRVGDRVNVSKMNQGLTIWSKFFFIPCFLRLFFNVIFTNLAKVGQACSLGKSTRTGFDRDHVPLPIIFQLKTESVSRRSPSTTKIHPSPNNTLHPPHTPPQLLNRPIILFHLPQQLHATLTNPLQLPHTPLPITLHPTPRLRQMLPCWTHMFTHPLYFAECIAQLFTPRNGISDLSNQVLRDCRGVVKGRVF
jgi:hypothetical protein